MTSTLTASTSMDAEKSYYAKSLKLRNPILILTPITDTYLSDVLMLIVLTIPVLPLLNLLYCAFLRKPLAVALTFPISNLFSTITLTVITLTKIKATSFLLMTSLLLTTYGNIPPVLIVTYSLCLFPS